MTDEELRCGPYEKHGLQGISYCVKCSRPYPAWAPQPPPCLPKMFEETDRLREENRRLVEAGTVICDEFKYFGGPTVDISAAALNAIAELREAIEGSK